MPLLVTVSGGVFAMGSAAGRPDERPVHCIRLPAFRAAVRPLSNAEYARFVRATGSPPPKFFHDPRFSDPDQPVVGVSWFDANAYCHWLACQTGIPFRLPTEAEREFTARDDLGDADRFSRPGDPPRATTRVARLDRPHRPAPQCGNGYGIRCMAENVHEWCSDWYAPDYYSRSPAAAPAGPARGTRRVSRGGSWRHAVKVTRLTARSSLDPARCYNDFGFRVYTDP